jgi:hypothetical protein
VNAQIDLRTMVHTPWDDGGIRRQDSGSVISGLEGVRWDYGDRYCCVGRYGSGGDCAEELLWTSLRIKIGREPAGHSGA